MGRWVRDHCTVGTGIQCRLRFKRDVDLNQLNVSVTDPGNSTELGLGEDICALVDTANMPFDGLAKDVLEMFFDQSDQDKGGPELLLMLLLIGMLGGGGGCNVRMTFFYTVGIEKCVEKRVGLTKTQTASQTANQPASQPASQPARQTDRQTDADICTNTRILTYAHTNIYTGTIYTGTVMYTHKTSCTPRLSLSSSPRNPN